MSDRKDFLDFHRVHPSCQEIVTVFDHLLAVLQAEEDMEAAEHPHDKPPASAAHVAELRHRLRREAQAARVQLALLKGAPAPARELHRPAVGATHG